MRYLHIHTAINYYKKDRLEEQYALKKLHTELKTGEKKDLFFGNCYKSFKQSLLSLHHGVSID